MESRRPVGGIPGIVIVRCRRPVSRIGQRRRCPALASPVLEQPVIFRHGLEIPVQQAQRLDIYFVVHVAGVFHDPSLGRLDAQGKTPEEIGLVVHKVFNECWTGHHTARMHEIPKRQCIPPGRANFSRLFVGNFLQQGRAPSHKVLISDLVCNS